LYLYKREVVVTRTNADEIGKAYGHNTGGKIYNFFSRYSTRNKLVGAELTDTINNNKLKNFEQVIVLLQDFPDALSRAKTDMAEFKRNAGFD
jgi:phage-related tail protein